MMELLLASSNPGKILEIKEILGESFLLKGLKDIGIFEEIPETGKTFHENALLKAEYVYKKTNLNVLADDSGLCIKALNDAPGVYSARYAGEPKSDEKNIQLVLEEMKDFEDRSAYFMCVICLIMKGSVYYFEGRVDGRIAQYPRGKNGFGYDPIFIPNGFNNTLAELPTEIKNQLSHRYIALKKMKDFLIDNV